MHLPLPRVHVLRFGEFVWQTCPCCQWAFLRIYAHIHGDFPRYLRLTLQWCVFFVMQVFALVSSSHILEHVALYVGQIYTTRVLKHLGFFHLMLLEVWTHFLSALLDELWLLSVQDLLLICGEGVSTDDCMTWRLHLSIWVHHWKLL